MIQFINSKAVIRMLDMGSEVNHGEYLINATLSFRNGSAPIEYNQLGYAEVFEKDVRLVLQLQATKVPWSRNNSKNGLSISLTDAEYETVEIGCNIQLEQKKTGYTKFLFLWMSFCVSLLSIQCLKSVAIQASQEPNIALSTSNYLVFIMVGFDIFWCFSYFIFTFYLGNAYVTYCLMLVVLQLVKILRGNLLIYQIVMKAFFDNLGLTKTPNEFKIRVLVYNLKHYLCLFVVFFTILKYSFQPSMLCLIASLLSVQVIHNATCNVTFLGNQTELVLAFLCHAWIPLYLHAWTDNFMMFSMKTSSVMAFFLLLGIVIYALCRQYLHGGDELLPQACRAERYNYLIRISTICPDWEEEHPNDTSSENIQRDMEESQNLCSICMNHLSITNLDESALTDGQICQNLKRVYESMKKNTRTHFMRTPCNHDYHITCLLTWMKIKMECPSCRRALPIVQLA